MGLVHVVRVHTVPANSQHFIQANRWFFFYQLRFGSEYDFINCLLLSVWW
jgi:hypothetical protein